MFHVSLPTKARKFLREYTASRLSRAGLKDGEGGCGGGQPGNCT